MCFLLCKVLKMGREHLFMCMGSVDSVICEIQRALSYGANVLIYKSMLPRQRYGYGLGTFHKCGIVLWARQRCIGCIKTASVIQLIIYSASVFIPLTPTTYAGPYFSRQNNSKATSSSVSVFIISFFSHLFFSSSINLVFSSLLLSLILLHVLTAEFSPLLLPSPSFVFPSFPSCFMYRQVTIRLLLEAAV